MLRIAICDDDLSFLDNFARMITTSFEDAGQQINVFTFSNGKSLIEKEVAIVRPVYYIRSFFAKTTLLLQTTLSSFSLFS